MRQFSAEHMAALAATALAAAVAVWLARRRPRWVVPFARGLALVMLGLYATEHAVNVARGTWTLDGDLPLFITDAVTVVTVVALWRPRPLLTELVYFWGLTASLLAIVTPDLGYAFPDVLYFTYFSEHSGPVVAACLFVFGLRLLPRSGSVWIIFGATLIFTGVAAIGNVLTGGNYMFLRRKPGQSSLLDLMGPWPWYIVSAAALALILFLVLDTVARLLRPRERDLAPVADVFVGRNRHPSNMTHLNTRWVLLGALLVAAVVTVVLVLVYTDGGGGGGGY
jgi:hypothetical integral membrane protein (TIGR02206 family)